MGNLVNGCKLTPVTICRRCHRMLFLRTDCLNIYLTFVEFLNRLLIQLNLFGHVIQLPIERPIYNYPSYIAGWFKASGGNRGTISDCHYQLDSQPVSSSTFEVFSGTFHWSFDRSNADVALLGSGSICEAIGMGGPGGGNFVGTVETVGCVVNYGPVVRGGGTVLYLEPGQRHDGQLGSWCSLNRPPGVPTYSACRIHPPQPVGTDCQCPAEMGHPAFSGRVSLFAN
jgi:hypothetical protein